MNAAASSYCTGSWASPSTPLAATPSRFPPSHSGRYTALKGAHTACVTPKPRYSARGPSTRAMTAAACSEPV